MWSRAFASCAILFASLCGIGQAQNDPNLATVIANVKAARGPVPSNESTATSFTRHGLRGTETRLRSGADYRVDTVLGPIHTAYGSVGGTYWRQNGNGLVVENADPAVEPSDEKYEATLAHVHSPSDLFVISRLSRLGTGSKEYVDPATWRVIRIDTITQTETTTSTYDDFRKLDGYERAWHRSISDGHPENDAVSTITREEDAPLARDALAVPKSREAVVFPAGQSSVVLPARLTEHLDKFIVRLTVAGRGLDFLLDTGASGMIIQRDVAQSMGLPEYGAYSSAANAGRYVGTTTIVPSLMVGTLAMHDVVMQTIPHVPADGSAYKVVGLLGFDFLDALSAKLDYANGTITAYDPTSFVAPSDPHAIALEVRLGTFAPRTSVTINGAVGTRFTIDTGGIGALTISDYFRRRYPSAVVDDHGTTDTRRISGVGGNIEAQFIEIAEMKIGGAEFERSNAYVLTSAAQYANADDGTVGPDLLRLFTVYLDYPRRRVYLVPGS